MNCEKMMFCKKLCKGHYTRLRKGNVREDDPLIKQNKKEVKLCENHLCQKIMYRDQEGFENKYCSKDCEQETHHWRTVTKGYKSLMEKEKKKFRNRLLKKKLSTGRYLVSTLQCNTNSI